MSVTMPIPAKLREEMEADPFYAKCCVTGGGKKTENRFDPDRIEWHHNFRWQGQRVNEKWCILPLVKWVHDMADTREIREILDHIMLNRADEATLRKYSKAEDLVAKRDRLNKRYENKTHNPILQPGRQERGTAPGGARSQKGPMDP